MKQRIRSIFVLMTVCIPGVLAFQTYWLYTSYQLHEQQFRRTVRGAFISAVEKQQFNDARRLFRVGLDKGPQRLRLQFREPALDDESEEPFAVNRVKDSLFVRINHSGPDNGERMKVRVIRSTRQSKDRIFIDTIARKISNVLIADWAGNHRFNLEKFDSTYRAELRLRDIDATFQLDTIQLKPELFRQQMQNRAQVVMEGPIKTSPMPINPVKNQFLQASFDTPTGYILRKMDWLLAGSALLMALTIWCFLYMLSTILKQKKLSEIKNDFINNMTHELKTPIATVSAAVEAMQHFGALNDPLKTKTYLNISKNELQRLSDLVEKVLNMAVDEKKELELNREWLKPAELIQEVVGNHQLQARSGTSEKPVAIEVEIEPENARVQADRLHLGNAINNLIDNAIKYSKESVQICINSQTDENGWRLTVQDNGNGIPKVYHEAIFDRFFRIPTGNLHPVKGFGLGLSYVRQVVEKHGGRIEVSSEPGRGSVFRIWIPN
ncbi:sensor histidine kinase [Larkinella rosea]|uniref:histidine kinase n=1 Tax=Larkinella rosea TaxID=2025312 RepID=A0A3P1BZZ0_9BACT|nr:HAMP domain-containing sensor histidine kinase [Larkinella rosea]RRB06558.1 sensor histidine kinase [Larkinella rosea]